MRKAAALVAACGAWVTLALAGCSDPSDNLDTSDREACIEALRQCAAGASDEVIDRVAEIAGHDDTLLAAEAVRALGRMRVPRAVDVLCEVASGARGRRDAIRQEAVTQLGRQESPKALAVLRQVVKMDPDPRVRVAAITSLAWQRSLEDVPLLVQVAETESDPVVQARAVGAVEGLVSLKFGYEPSAPPEERQEALRRMRSLALTAARSVRAWREERERQRQK